MLGLMQDWPLLIHRVIDHAAVQHATREVVSRSVEGPVHRTTYAALRGRALRVAKRLRMEGIEPGDRVATLAWNGWRHVEAWYGITGVGAIYHTVNPRLFPEQIAWIINHAEDRVLMVDLTFVPLLEGIAARLPRFGRVIVLCASADLPETSLPNVVAYEAWLAEADEDFAWAALDERAAAGLCYTSGTTGEPKGVLYSHRSNVLHAMQICAADALAPRAADSVLCVVPMFHANVWALAFALPMCGAKMVLPGAKLDGASIFALLEEEAVTFTAGVPTVWSMLLDYMDETGRRPSTLKRVAVGGAACPRSMIERFQGIGIAVDHAWGMTEMSPVGTIARVKPARGTPNGEALVDIQVKQGSAPFGVEMIVTDEDGRPLPWDGEAVGRVKVRGPCVARTYFRSEAPILDADGYFDTGDVAAIDPDGTMRIVDRAKDIIKSGGEWISSVALETLALGHPAVADAAVIGVPHAKWGERPLLLVVARAGAPEDPQAILAFMRDRIAKWWVPDEVRYIGNIPHTATGKINKVRLREMVGGESREDAR